ncbi:MAG: ParB/RepB/Spo0J family partition protein [Phycisphaerae bacterium]|nr:ParB/RepB/Spo0J family partition protein [Phycisphaerae bacterium]
MAEPRKRLGRGLNSLLSSTRLQENETQDSPVTTALTPDKYTGIDRIIEIGVEKINRNPHQPRSYWDQDRLSELADSIKANGLIQPIIVREMGDGYQLIAGERRLRATRMADKNTILAIVKEANEEQMVEWALIENIHRADLNPLERALAYQRYLQKFAINQSDAAEKLGEDRSTIANYIRLLELPDDVKQLLSEGKISMGHARALLGLKIQRQQVDLALHIANKGMSVRELEKKVKSLQQGEDIEKTIVQKGAHVLELEQEMAQSLGTKVQIKTAGKNKHRGKIIIEFYNLDDFDRLRSKFCNDSDL